MLFDFGFGIYTSQTHLQLRDYRAMLVSWLESKTSKCHYIAGKSNEYTRMSWVSYNASNIRTKRTSNDNIRANTCRAYKAEKNNTMVLQVERLKF